MAAAVVGRVWSSEIQEAEDDGDDGFEADFGAPGKAGGQAWMFKCFEINIGGRSLGRKPQRKKLSDLRLLPLSQSVALVLQEARGAPADRR